MTPFSPRLLLRLLLVLLVALFAAPSVVAQERAHHDAASAVTDNSAQPVRQVDHASKKVRHPPSLEAYFEIDDDAEQYFKSHPVAARDAASFALALHAPVFSCHAAPALHRPCAAYPTGPPHA